MDRITWKNTILAAAEIADEKDRAARKQYKLKTAISGLNDLLVLLGYHDSQPRHLRHNLVSAIAQYSLATGIDSQADACNFVLNAIQHEETERAT